MTLTETLQAAVAAGQAATLAVWERDGKIDRGTCGGAMLEFDGRSKVAKEAEALGITYRSGNEYWLTLKAPEGVRSQNADIPEAQFRAFKKVLDDAGLGKAVKRFWTYID